MRLRVSRGRGWSGGAGVRGEKGGAFLVDDLGDVVVARSALELAAERAIGAVGAGAAATGGSTHLILANRIAGTDDHGMLIVLMRPIRK